MARVYMYVLYAKGHMLYYLVGLTGMTFHAVTRSYLPRARSTYALLALYCNKIGYNRFTFIVMSI